MDKLEALAAAHGWAETEMIAWRWAATLHAETRWTVELALARNGVDGIGDLVLAGPALGGLDAAQLAELVAMVEADLRALLAAA